MVLVFIRNNLNEVRGPVVLVYAVKNLNCVKSNIYVQQEKDLYLRAIFMPKANESMKTAKITRILELIGYKTLMQPFPTKLNL